MYIFRIFMELNSAEILERILIKNFNLQELV